MHADGDTHPIMTAQYISSTCEYLTQQHMASELINMVTSSDEYDFLTLLAICTEGARATHPTLTWQAIRLNREQTQEGATCPHLGASLVFVHQCRSHFTSTSCVSWTHLSWGRNCMRQQLSKSPCLSTCFYASIRSIELSPQHNVVHNSSPFTADIARLCFRGLSSLTTSAAALQWSLLQMLLLQLPDCVRFACCMLPPDCIRFSCCSRLLCLLDAYIHLWSCTRSTKYNKYKGRASPV